jgi:putative ABC transport system permease protein
MRWGSADGAGLSWASLPYAAAALAVVVVIALVGQRRVLSEPVVELLRGVRRGRVAWRARLVEVLVAALAVLATIQLRAAADPSQPVTATGLGGLGLLVPGLLTVVVALLVSRALVPVVGLVGRRALRAGRLGLGLAAAQVSRRPGSQPLFVLLAVASALLAFVAAGIDVADRAREQRALVQTGAPRVVQLATTDVRRMLLATRQVDPEGAWAMAVVNVPQSVPSAPPLLAVDASRLNSVPVWRPEYGATAEQVAQVLRAPTDPAPFVFKGTAVTLDVMVQADLYVNSTFPLRTDVELEFVPLNGDQRIIMGFRNLAPGRQSVTEQFDGCAQGCRLTGITVPYVGDAEGVTVYGIRQQGPAGDVVSPQALGDPTRWRSAAGSLAVASRDSLGLSFGPGRVTTTRLRVGAVDVPSRVPVVAAGVAEVPSISSLDGQLVKADEKLQLNMVPRLGLLAALADLGYLERSLADVPGRQRAEIWLGEAAPPDAVDRLRAAGLPVLGETGVAQTRTALARQGPALAVQFHAEAALFGVLLALGGLGLIFAVDRRPRAAELAALRVQGLRARTIRRASLWGYVSLVVAACVTGLIGAAVAWLAAGDRLPIFADTQTVLTPPRWPLWSAVLRPWALCGVALVLAAVVAAVLLRRAAARVSR